MIIGLGFLRFRIRIRRGKFGAMIRVRQGIQFHLSFYFGARYSWSTEKANEVYLKRLLLLEKKVFLFPIFNLLIKNCSFVHGMNKSFQSHLRL